MYLCYFMLFLFLWLLILRSVCSFWANYLWRAETGDSQGNWARAAWISVCFPPPLSPRGWLLSGLDSFLSPWLILITALLYGDRKVVFIRWAWAVHPGCLPNPFSFTWHIDILLLAEMPCRPASTFSIITSDPWTFPQCAHAPQTSCSQQGSLHVPRSMPPGAIFLSCSLDQSTLSGSCFLHQSLPLPWFSFSSTWQHVEKSDVWILEVSYLHWSLSVSRSPYSWLTSRKRAFIVFYPDLEVQGRIILGWEKT